jgi:histidine triad (HIT) family protein
MSDCIFCQIASKQIPVDLVYEDDSIVIFNDIAPQAPIHLLIVPKQHIPTLQDLSIDDSQLLTNVFLVAQKMAEKFGVVEKGYRLVVNYGEQGGQSVFHLHFHFLAGRQLNWPPG